MFHNQNFNAMVQEKTTPRSPWAKIGKLFLEFLVAAVTAFVTTISGQAMNIW